MQPHRCQRCFPHRPVLRQQGANSPSPLIGVPGILVTPHMGTLTRETMQRVGLSVATSVIAALRGEGAHAVTTH